MTSVTRNDEHGEAEVEKKTKVLASSTASISPLTHPDSQFLSFDPRALLSSSEFEDEFARIATSLLSSYVLIIDNRIHSIHEIEFYYNSESDVFIDPFTHSHPFQHRRVGHFYFHRLGKSMAYKSGTYKGMDITFGNREIGYGGILIRTIKDIQHDRFIEGPCKVVDWILELIKLDSINDLVDKCLNKNTCAFSNQKLRIARIPSPSLSLETPSASKSLSSSSPSKQYSLTNWLQRSPHKQLSSSTTTSSSSSSSNEQCREDGSNGSRKRKSENISNDQNPAQKRKALSPEAHQTAHSDSSSASSSSSSAASSSSSSSRSSIVLVKSARVGLALKGNPIELLNREKWICRPYRFTTTNYVPTKFKPLVLIAMHTVNGIPMDRLAGLSNTRVEVIRKYIECWRSCLQDGDSRSDFTKFHKKSSFSVDDLIQLNAAWAAKYGSVSCQTSNAAKKQ